MKVTKIEMAQVKEGGELTLTSLSRLGILTLVGAEALLSWMVCRISFMLCSNCLFSFSISFTAEGWTSWAQWLKTTWWVTYFKSTWPGTHIWLWTVRIPFSSAPTLSLCCSALSAGTRSDKMGAGKTKNKVVIWTHRCQNNVLIIYKCSFTNKWGTKWLSHPFPWDLLSVWPPH